MQASQHKQNNSVEVLPSNQGVADKNSNISFDNMKRNNQIKELNLSPKAGPKAQQRDLQIKAGST